MSAAAPPAWAQRLADALPALGAAVGELQDARTRAVRQGASEAVPPSTRTGRRAAVLVLLSPGESGAGDVVLTERAAGLRSHPGQVSFPGGRLDPVDQGDPVRAALREAAEEVALDPAGVEVLGTAGSLQVPPTGASVVPVLAWEPDPAPLAVADPREVARVIRVPLPQLVDPARRAVVRTRAGWTGPTFTVDAHDDADGAPGGGDPLVVWGFTAAVLDAALRLAGLERPWDATRALPLSAVSGGRALAAADEALR